MSFTYDPGRPRNAAVDALSAVCSVAPDTALQACGRQAPVDRGRGGVGRAIVQGLVASARRLCGETPVVRTGTGVRRTPPKRGCCQSWRCPSTLSWSSRRRGHTFWAARPESVRARPARV